MTSVSQGVVITSALSQLAVYATGTNYTLTNASAAVTFGTTSPSLTITATGQWIISAGVTVEYVGATFAANQTVPVKLRRTNNTAADLASAAITGTTAIITTLTFTPFCLTIPDVSYTTSNTNDAIAIFAHVSTLPGAGSIQISNAWINAVRIA